MIALIRTQNLLWMSENSKNVLLMTLCVQFKNSYNFLTYSETKFSIFFNLNSNLIRIKFQMGALLCLKNKDTFCDIIEKSDIEKRIAY